MDYLRCTEKSFFVLLISCSLLAHSCSDDALTSLQATSSAIVGVVFPDSVTATVRALQIQEKARTETDANGRFELRNLLPGVYTVEITAAGFRKFVRDEVTLFASGTTTMGEIHLDNRPSQIVATFPEDGEQEVTMTQRVRLSFREPMNRQAVEQTFSIAPAIDGETQWASSGSSSVFEFRPIPRFQPATEYVVTLTKGALTANGDSLEFDYSFRFTTQAVQVVRVFPENGAIFVRPRSVITIIFNTFMNLESVENAFQIEPVTEGGFQWSDFDRMAFLPGASLFADTQYTVTVSTSAVDFEGTPLEQPLEFSFQTEPLRVENHNPSDGQRFVNTGASILIAFNADMNQSSVENAFSLNPAAAGTFVWTAGRTVRFSPNSALQANTAYQVRIETGAQDLGGTNLNTPLSFSFTTSQ